METLRISTKEAVPGMIVAAPVVDKKGRMLIPANMRLTALHIACLGRWGIDDVEIVVPDDPAAAAEATAVKTRTTVGLVAPSERVLRIEERLNTQFGDVLDRPLMKELKTAVLRRLAAHVGPLPGELR